MRFRTRAGVVLTEICGQFLLVSAEAIRDFCPYVTQINESSAFLWKQMEKGASLAELEKAVAEEYELNDPAAAREAIRSYVQQMMEMNYLIEEKQEENHEK